MPDITNKTFKVNTKDINYVNRDFVSLKSQLIDFTKYYYPQNYKDFSPSSPGTIFIEQAAYVGDILSYYTDKQFKESFLQFSQDRRNLINLAKVNGYKPKVSTAAQVTLDIFQLLPPTRNDDVDGTYIPDERYTLILKPNTEVSNDDGITFIIPDSIDFSEDTQFSPREVTVYNRDSSAPLFYLLKKTTKAYSGQIVSTQFSLTDSDPFLKLKLNETNVLKILEIVDSNNNKFYETDYLAQDTIPIEVDNLPINNQILSRYKTETPKLLKYIRTANRFVTIVDEDNFTYLQFGANTENFDNTIISPNPTNIGVGLANLNNLNISLDNTNFTKSKSYGVTPTNTTLTVKYIIGGGLESNVNSDSINKVVSVSYQNDVTALTDSEVSLLNNIKNSLRVNNPEPSVGGRGPETNEEIRQNAIANISTQNRMVTKDDILLRCYSLPSQFGNIAKVYVESNSSREISYTGIVPAVIDGSTGQETANLSELNPLDRRKFLESTNPFVNNLYILTYDNNKNLTTINEATIYNLKNYLSKYRILTDRINIIDGYIINIGVDYKITVYNGFNKREVLNETLIKVKEFFDIENWGFNQPINLSQLTFSILQTEGVQSVNNIKVKNLTIDDGDYSAVAYNLSIAQQDNIIYPSKDPSIFEVKFPENDIRGLVV